MKAEKEVLQGNGAKKARLKMTYSILALTALFVAELYLMMNYPKNYLFIGIVGLVILCFVYLITDLVFKLQNDKEALRNKEYESIYKAEKVSYVFMKQSFLDMERVLDRIREICEVPADELIEAQKAIGRVTIQRNKENIRTLAAGNESLAMQIQDLDHKIQETLHAVEELKSSDSVMEALEGIKAAFREELMNLEVFTESKMNAVSNALMQEMEQSDSALQERLNSLGRLETRETARLPEDAEASGVSEDLTMIEEPQAAAEPVISAEPEAAAAEEPVMAAEPETAALEEPEMAAEPETAVVEEPVISAEPETVEAEAPEMTMEPEVMAEPAMVNEPETIEAEEPEMAAAEEEPAMAEEPQAAEEPVTAAEPKTAEGSILPEKIREMEIPTAPKMPEPEAEQPILPEMAVVSKEEKGSEPVLESGKTMTPEEVARLLEEMDESTETAAPKEEPPAPAASDPGHVMTPEEIAALLANM